jgi:peptidoglycan/LPS O-acetylase OafA/YrhL
MDSGEGRADAADPGFVWQIDLLRFLFAALVVVGHAYALTREFHPEFRMWPLDRFASGGLWVAGFFVLSGWCIERSGRGRDGRGVAGYLLARVTRIMPLYLWFLAIVGVTEVAFAAIGDRPAMWEPHARNLFWQATMLQGILDPFGAYNASWSLTHELLCYFAWGGILAGVSPRRRRPVAFALALGLLAAAALAHAAIGTRGSYTAVSLPLYFFFWLLGNLAAADPVPTDRRRERRFARVVLVVCGATTAVNLVVPLYGDTVWMVFWSLALAAALRLLTARDAVPPPHRRVVDLARRAGLASYPVYLGHGLFLIAFGTLLNFADLRPPPLLLLPASIAVALVAAIAAGLPAEIRFLAWRAALLRGRTRPADAPAHGVEA